LSSAFQLLILEGIIFAFKTGKSIIIMKTIIKTILIVLLIASQASAQTLSGGIAAGVSTSSVKITEIPTGFGNVIKGNDIRGFEAGLYARAGFDPFYVKPLVLFNYKHGTVDFYNNNNEYIESSGYTMNRLLIPVMFGFKILGPVGIEAGPVYNYVISATKNIGGNEVKLMKNGLGYRVGAAAEFGRLILNVSYQGIKNSSSGDSDISSYSTPDELIFGIGVKLSK
jgi:outer membrane protein with beta-barrel domain